MTERDLQRLLRFYLACIEAEDRRSLTKKLSSLHRSLLSPWDDEEPLFHSEAAEAVFETQLKSEQKLLTGNTALAGTAERFVYGHPIFLDGGGFLSPLFFTDVEVEARSGCGFAVRRIDPADIQLNHHVFRRQHAQIEELRALQEALEGEYGAFYDRLRAAFEALGLPDPGFAPDHLEAYPTTESPRNRWLNRPVLFKSERSVYTHHLRRELEALVEIPRLSSALGTTALGSIAGFTSIPARQATDHPDEPRPLLQVLPLNDGQEKAARAGLEAPIVVVTGPPGTGKSQVVVDLLASSAAAGQPVLFASKNNKAVDVVRTRLREVLGEALDWTLRLGSRNVMEISRQEMDGRLAGVQTVALPVGPSPDLIHRADEAIATARRQIKQLDHARSEYLRLQDERRMAESLVDDDWVESWPEDAPCPDFDKTERLAVTADALAGKRRAGLWLRLKRALLPTLLKRSVQRGLASLVQPLQERIRGQLIDIANRPSADLFVPIAEACTRLAYVVRWRAAEHACSRALHVLGTHEPATVLADQLSQLQSNRSHLARDQLRAAWTGRLVPRAAFVRHSLNSYFDLSSRVRQSRGRKFLQVLAAFKQTVQSVGAHLPVWIVTNLSARNALPLEPNLFDLVVIDEASQCDIPSALPLLFRARRALIIGDPRQLRHISTLSPSEEQHLAGEHGVADHLATWSYNQRSLYALAEGAVLARGKQPHFLAEHYRSHPEIIEFSNRTFYQGQLVLRTKVEGLRALLREQSPGVFWHDVTGTVPQSTRSAVNEVELQKVLALLDEWAATGFLLRDDVDFGVVTPFRLQMERLREVIRERSWWRDVEGRLTVGTAHRFQGDERDVMIFSPVVAEGMSPRLAHWVATTDQLLNVAITRARAALHVVGDLRACISAGGCLGDFAISANSGPTEFRSSSVPLESPAETRMAELLSEVNLWFAPQHVVSRYRLDFLVVTPFGTRYDVEVDGRGHRTDEAIRGDEARDSALGAMGLKILRFDARRVFNDGDEVREVLRRLV